MISSVVNCKYASATSSLNTSKLATNFSKELSVRQPVNAPYHRDQRANLHFMPGRNITAPSLVAVSRTTDQSTTVGLVIGIQQRMILKAVRENKEQAHPASKDQCVDPRGFSRTYNAQVTA